MDEYQRDGDAERPWKLSAWTVIWNSVVPGLGVALMLGASVMPALAIATAVSLGIIGVFVAGSGGERSLQAVQSPAVPRRA